MPRCPWANTERQGVASRWARFSLQVSWTPFAILQLSTFDKGSTLWSTWCDSATIGQSLHVSGRAMTLFSAQQLNRRGGVAELGRRTPARTRTLEHNTAVWKAAAVRAPQTFRVIGCGVAHCPLVVTAPSHPQQSALTTDTTRDDSSTCRLRRRASAGRSEGGAPM